MNVQQLIDLLKTKNLNAKIVVHCKEDLVSPYSHKGNK